MAWFVIYETATGRLVSQGTVVADPLPAGLTSVDLGTKPDDSLMWDEVTAAFIPRPAKVLVDRVEDILTDSRISGVVAILNPAQENSVRTVIGEVLGIERFRNEAAGKVIV